MKQIDKLVEVGASGVSSAREVAAEDSPRLDYQALGFCGVIGHGDRLAQSRPACASGYASILNIVFYPTSRSPSRSAMP
jgi:hypothetical protein